jgi:hypothetical protein
VIIRLLAFLAARRITFQLRVHFLSCSGQIKQRNERIYMVQRKKKEQKKMVEGLRKEEEGNTE